MPYPRARQRPSPTWAVDALVGDGKGALSSPFFTSCRAGGARWRRAPKMPICSLEQSQHLQKGWPTMLCRTHVQRGQRRWLSSTEGLMRMANSIASDFLDQNCPGRLSTTRTCSCSMLEKSAVAMLSKANTNAPALLSRERAWWAGVRGEAWPLLYTLFVGEGVVQCAADVVQQQKQTKEDEAEAGNVPKRAGRCLGARWQPSSATIARQTAPE